MSEVKKSAFDVLLDEMGKCKDFRVEGRTVYPLTEILFLTICGSMSNCTTDEEIVDFGELRLEWLRKYLPFKDGIPSHDTINRVLGLLDPTTFPNLLTNWANHGLKLPNGSVIPIDGKWIAKSVTTKQKQTKKIDGGKSAIMMVNAYCVHLSKCLTSICIEGKNGEKQAFESIVDLLDVSGLSLIHI